MAKYYNKSWGDKLPDGTYEFNGEAKMNKTPRPTDGSPWIAPLSEARGPYVHTVQGVAGAGLKEADLSGADLSGAYLYGADLYKANLYGADLYGADLYKANLEGANLEGANLYGADLSGTDLYKANLEGAKFHNGFTGTKETKVHQISPIGSEAGTLILANCREGWYVNRGCWRASVEEFLEAVKEKHGYNEHGVKYRKVIEAFCEEKKF